ncbi:hypothetical protein GCM10022221_45590 [Actinocorallia aurea]
MVVFFQYGNGLFLPSALRHVDRGAEDVAAAAPDLAGRFYAAADLCEARYRTMPCGAVLQAAHAAARRSPAVAEVTERGPLPGHRNDGFTVHLHAGRALSWYAPDWTPRAFPALRFDLGAERSGEAMFFVYGCSTESPPPEREAAWYRLVADPWGNSHLTEVRTAMSALLAGDVRIVPAEPPDLSVPFLDDVLAAVRDRFSGGG